MKLYKVSVHSTYDISVITDKRYNNALEVINNMASTVTDHHLYVTHTGDNLPSWIKPVANLTIVGTTNKGKVTTLPHIISDLLTTGIGSWFDADNNQIIEPVRLYMDFNAVRAGKYYKDYYKQDCVLSTDHEGFVNFV